MLKYCFDSLLNLFFPRICPGCSRILLQAEKHLCVFCINNLSHTGYFREQGNPVEELFKGRLPCVHAAALFWFKKETTIQYLLHELKYKGRKELGTAFGMMLANEIKQTGWAPVADCILPVPMHARKKRKRGYNQAECIANGMSQVLGIPVITSWVEKKRQNKTQAKQANRFARWSNVESVYASVLPAGKSYRHVIVVDDVLTTGSTLEACAKQVLKTPGTSVYLATVAYTRL